MLLTNQDLFLHCYETGLFVSADVFAMMNIVSTPSRTIHNHQINHFSFGSISALVGFKYKFFDIVINENIIRNEYLKKHRNFGNTEQKYF